MAVCAAVLLLAGLTADAGAHEAAARFVIRSAAYLDQDGDHDIFPDTGETGRLAVTVVNTGAPLASVVASLSSADPDVACLAQFSLPVGDVAAGAAFTVGSLDPSAPGLVFKAAETLETGSAASPATIDFCLRFAADGWVGFSTPVCFSLVADLDLPAGATQVFTTGPDGAGGTSDDGTIVEGFDLDRDGDGAVTVLDTFLEAVEPGVYRGTCSNAPGTFCAVGDDCPPAAPGGPPRTCSSGAYVRGDAAGGLLDRVAGVACGGFRVPPENPACALDPDFPMDWHLHCPPGATNCPNLQSGPCVGGCSYASNDGPKALSPPNSLHMGAHFTAAPSTAVTTQHLRTLQGFMSAPLNLAPFPRAGDLELSFSQIVRLMDSNSVSLGNNAFQCNDCADVQVQVDLDPDPDLDRWGYWEKLVPFQNAYDHTPFVWSAASGKYCVFTPADAGPPAPEPVRETLCFPRGAWSTCGNSAGTTAARQGCAGPGQIDPSGSGVWIETRFDLQRFLGQRVRLRWIGATWTLDEATSSYFDLPEWHGSRGDDGWWVDDIRLTGGITRQVVPLADAGAAPPGMCGDLCLDADGDGYGAPSPACAPGTTPDCDDTNAATYDGAGEVNDGEDNQCPGNAGYGIADEVTGVRLKTGSPPRLCWDYQPLASTFQVAVSSRPEFGECALRPVASTAASCDDAPEIPPSGGILYYLMRALSPHTGSWGQDSSGRERMPACGS